MMLCAACGRRLTNDPDASNGASWTLDPYGVGGQMPYCADSPECQHDAEQIVGAA